MRYRILVECNDPNTMPLFYVKTSDGEEDDTVIISVYETEQVFENSLEIAFFPKRGGFLAVKKIY